MLKTNAPFLGDTESEARRGKAASASAMQTLVFDFDGTLADSLGVLLACLNELAERFGYAEFEDVQALRSLPLREVLRHHMRLNPVEALLWRRRMRTLIRRKRGDIRLFPGIRTMLLSLCREGLPLYLVTSSPLDHVLSVLARDEAEAFVRTYSGVGLWRKARAITRLRCDIGAAARDTWYVGDETRDAESCRKAGVPMIGVTWGLNDAVALRSAGARIVVSTPEELRSCVARLREPQCGWSSVK